MLPAPIAALTAREPTDTVPADEMAGDLGLTELPVLEAPRGAEERLPTGRVLHRFGRVSIISPDPDAAGADIPREPEEVGSDDLDETERLGLAALRLRESDEYRAAKLSRPRDGEPWEMTDCTSVEPPPSRPAPGARAARGPTSAYLEGSVAVGVVIVQGPDSGLKFSEEERTKVIAEVQNGLGFFIETNPLSGITFSFEIRDVQLDVPADPEADDLEALWRDPAMAALGFSPDWSGVDAYVEDLRTRLATNWTYCAFFTKYPLAHFAYAFIGGPRLVMDYDNDGWGPDNIDRVFAHETGHIFGAPDEYASSNCDCGGSWGRYGLPNLNCETCAAGGGVDCLMRGNTWALCAYTPGHLGWPPELAIPDFGTNSSWRVDRHPRFVADTSGDGRRDVVGFGDHGVWVARAAPEDGFERPELIVGDYGYIAGSWRVDRHPRLLADTSGDGRPDIVGFGDHGVWLARALPGGGFAPLELVINDMGYEAGGWRVERHPRFLADTTGDGRRDIVGFGNDGVWVARAVAGSGFEPMELVIEDLGYNAGGWRVERHPRFLADTSGDGRADIIGFGNDGVWLARALPGGGFGAPELVIEDLGHDAGGWRVERHPRLLADTTGDRRRDIVGFGNDGVWFARALPGGAFAAPQLVLGDLGYDAGGWRVERHPRFLADTTGDGCADIVGFGNDGVWVARAGAGGGFEPPQFVIPHYGYDAGHWVVPGWRPESHPRLMADMTGDRRADILGFGAGGAYLSSL
jgi:hypothetical protein